MWSTTVALLKVVLLRHKLAYSLRCAPGQNPRPNLRQAPHLPVVKSPIRNLRYTRSSLHVLDDRARPARKLRNMHSCSSSRYRSRCLPPPLPPLLLPPPPRGHDGGIPHSRSSSSSSSGLRPQRELRPRRQLRLLLTLLHRSQRSLRSPLSHLLDGWDGYWPSYRAISATEGVHTQPVVKKIARSASGRERAG